MLVDGNIAEWAINLNWSVYGLKQVNAKWFDILKTGQESRGYHQYQFYPSVFYRKDSVILTCWWFCNSLTQTGDNHINNWITK